MSYKFNHVFYFHLYFGSLWVTRCLSPIDKKSRRQKNSIWSENIWFNFDLMAFATSNQKFQKYRKMLKNFSFDIIFRNLLRFKWKSFRLGIKLFVIFFVHFFAGLHFILLRVFSTLIARTSQSSDQDSLIGKLAFSKKAIMTTKEAIGFAEKSAPLPDVYFSK